MPSQDASGDQPENLARSTYESLVNSLPLCVLIKGLDGRRLFANHAYLSLRKTTLDQIVGKRDEDLFPTEIAKQFSSDDRKVLIEGETLQSVEETRDGDNNQMWIERVKTPIRNSRGQIAGLQLVFWDVTSRTEAEEQLKFERHLFDTLLKNLPDSIFFKDTDSRFLRISDAMAKKFGFASVQQVVGKTDADVFSKEHAEEARNDELEIIRSGTPLVDRIEKETWHERDDTWCMSTKMAFRDHNGNVIGTFGISRDISDLVKSQDNLQKARDAADKANRAKSEFLANMSHEIRTPMNAIIGMSELLSQTELTHEQQDYVELIRESSTLLMRLLNDILDFSRIEARRLEIETTAFSIRDVVEKTVRTLSIRAQEKDLELTCRIAPDVPNLVLGDPGRIRQVLINLVGNGIKFTTKGEVGIDVGRLSEDSSQSCELVFRVKDTGIGIDQEKQAAVMEPFTQADASTTRRFGGTGLGLTISRELVQLMGGKMSMESESGVGTTFTFTLPLEIASADSAQVNSKLVGLPVLVVDDNPTNRRILDEVLTAWKCVPTLAASGSEAIEKVAAAKDDMPFRLVILDYMMPEMDGYEVAVRLRELCDAKDLKLIVLSSATHRGASERFSQLGVDRYMTKPFVQSELMNTVLQVMEFDEVDIAPSNEASEVSATSLRVLVAEDGLANQHVAKGLLRVAGHNSAIASNGIEALERWQQEEFDLILMDMHMPSMDGLEATRRIREKEKGTGNHIPIIALTAAAMKEDAAACLDAGMDDYLCKPINSESLQAMLAKYSSASRASSESEATSASVGNDDEVVDLETASKSVAGGMKGLITLAPIFRKESESLVEQIKKAAKDEDVEELRRAAHTLKGSANLFAAKQLVGAALKIEESSREGELGEMPALIMAVERELERVLTAIQRLL